MNLNSKLLTYIHLFTKAHIPIERVHSLRSTFSRPCQPYTPQSTAHFPAHAVSVAVKCPYIPSRRRNRALPLLHDWPSAPVAATLVRAAATDAGGVAAAGVVGSMWALH